MKKFVVVFVGVVFVMFVVSLVFVVGKIIVVFWKIFQEECWKCDEVVIKKIVEVVGDKYIFVDVQGFVVKQLMDVELFILQGVNVLLIVLWDLEVIMLVVQKVKDEGILMIVYDVQIEDLSVFYMIFNNVGVGKMMVEEVVKVKDKGNFVIIKGDQGDLNFVFLFKGMMEVIKLKVDFGVIKIVGEVLFDGWKLENVQKNMEQILIVNNNKVDVVFLQNDGMVGGVVVVFFVQGFVGFVLVIGQDGDVVVINCVVFGIQIVLIWKDLCEFGKVVVEVVFMLVDGKDVLFVLNVQKFKDGVCKVEMNVVFFKFFVVIKDMFGDVIKVGWIDKVIVCVGVKVGSVKVCD